MKKVLFVGEHPLGHTGNGKMMRALLSQLDTEEYTPSCFVFESSADPTPRLFDCLPVNIVAVSQWDMDSTMAKLLNIAQRAELDYMVFVGVDVWYYSRIYPQLRELAFKRSFKFVQIFPYDIQALRSDWVEWINNIDYPYVYSRYGYDKLKGVVPNLKYFRPPFDMPDIWKPVDEEEKNVLRKKLFPSITEEDFLFAAIGPNQIRKDYPRLIKAFSMIKEEQPNAKLYLHCNSVGAYNIIQTAEDYGLQSGDLIMRKEGVHYAATDMPNLYHAFDCFVNCSLQEGLSWTTLEAMLCGIPVIASNSTAHIELLDDAGALVRCEDLTYLPLFGKRGETLIEAFACNPQDIAEAMDRVMTNKLVRDRMTLFGRDFGLQWLEDVSDINNVLEEVLEVERVIPVEEKTLAILFAQHSAGGDVLMTTRCLKGLKERHPDLPLHYMTQPQYVDIVADNPLIDMVIPEWDESQLKKYRIVYNPHGERILPGQWGRNANSILADFYWRVLYLDRPDDFYIHKEKPPNRLALPEVPFCVVHTTGGDSHFRTYKYMANVCKYLEAKGYPTIQIGGPDDYPAGASFDWRGLRRTQDAWIMSKARFAVTVDSFHSHLAGALGVSQVALYGSGNASVCQPKQVGGTLICLSPDYIMDCQGLGPCSGSVRDCAVPCTSSHSPGKILKAIDQIIRREGK